MRSLCALLRRNLCRMSEEAAFGRRANVDSLMADTSLIKRLAPLPTDENGGALVEGGDNQRSASGTLLSSSIASASCASVSGSQKQSVIRISGEGTVAVPFELSDDDDDDNASVDSDDTITITRVVTSATASRGASTHSAKPAARVPLAEVTNEASSNLNNSQPSTNLKRKASQQLGNAEERRPQPSASTSTGEAEEEDLIGYLTPPPEADRTAAAEEDLIRFSSPVSSSPRDHATEEQANTEEQEGEEGELTVATTEKIVDSLWKACNFFCSPNRARFSNCYGYNTFMITLTLHLLSMLETLRHLYRDEAVPKRRYFSQRKDANTKGKQRAEGEVKMEVDSGADLGGFGKGTGNVDTANDTGQEEDAEEEEDEFGLDDTYSLTEDTIRALNVENATLDLDLAELSFDL